VLWVWSGDGYQVGGGVEGGGFCVRLAGLRERYTMQRYINEEVNYVFSLLFVRCICGRKIIDGAGNLNNSPICSMLRHRTPEIQIR
jgi:hypothetical protein